MKKADPIKALYLKVKTDDPGAPARRTLDQWELAVLLALAALGRLQIRTPVGNEKTPRPDPAGVARIKWGDIDDICKVYNNIDHILRELREAPGSDKPTNLQRALTKALTALEEAEEIPTECYPFILALHQAIGEALENIAITPSRKAA